jgi:hypothetical protein
MAFSILAGASLLFQGGEAVAGNQASQKAKGTAQTLIDTQTKQAASAASAASSAASQGAAVAKKRAIVAGGQSATILTGPEGAPAAPTTRKTLLGL